MKPIFLSYARIDNDKDEQDEKQGWVAYVCSRLRLALSPKLGKRLDFWRDVQDIEKNATWHEPIKSALKEARVLLAILSPSFFESENCKFELQHFLDCHKDSDSKTLAESVIKIVKHQIDSKALPLPLREPEPFEFFVRDPVKGELSYYNPSTGLRADRQQEFMDELERLANRLAVLLKEAGEVAASQPITTVFLGVPHPDSTVGELYQRIKAELERRNVRVVPDRKRFFADLDEPDPIILEQAVTNARLAVHLLDPTVSGKAMALDARLIDATATRARDATRLRRLIWLKGKPGSATDNPLVTSLRRLHGAGGRLCESDNLVEESSERFIDLLLRTLFPDENERKANPGASACYLLVHGDDDVSARSLAMPELRSRGLRFRLPVPARLGSDDQVAIYWGAKDARWVFDEIGRLQGRSIVLIKGPPTTPEKTTFFADEIVETIDLTASLPTGAAK